jgi:predicted DNA-binding antitoxin AbrB/MazE fold protein
MKPIEARYEDGLLKPETPLALRPGERVALIVVRHPDPRRWNLDRLAGTEEDRLLAEQGLAEWAEALDEEDRG